MFTPVRVSSPLPIFTNPLVPLTAPESVRPLNTFSVDPDNSVALPLTKSPPELRLSPKVTEPESTIAFAIERLVAESLETRPPASNRVPVPSAMLFPICTAPSLSLNPPVKVLIPASVSTPDPPFTTAPDPLIRPE